ncbi:cuticle protein 18.7-like [Schistocerca piceifrons]|uniref:cuticle protein 18.7-like n=1 Tax=Schistocerca piceifrons TaxID=274613 RepID=UPI001F5FD1A5|nr:cuticle protein 18.7-like [Schistocerca piceifrons]
MGAQFSSSSSISSMKVLVVLSAILAVALAKPGYLGAARAIAAAPTIAAAPALAYSAAPALAYSAAPAVVAAPIHAGYAAYGPANIALGADGIPLDTPEVAASKAAHLNAVAETRVRDAIVNSAAVVAAAPAIAAAAPAVIDARTAAAHAIAAPALRYAAAAPAVAYSAIHPGYAAYGPANIVIGPNGVPLDTPEVAAGKVADAVAHLEAKARNGLIL